MPLPLLGIAAGAFGAQALAGGLSAAFPGQNRQGGQSDADLLKLHKQLLEQQNTAITSSASFDRDELLRSLAAASISRGTFTSGLLDRDMGQIGAKSAASLQAQLGKAGSDLSLGIAKIAASRPVGYEPSVWERLAAAFGPGANSLAFAALSKYAGV